MIFRYVVKISGFLFVLILCSCATVPIPTEQAKLVPKNQVIDDRYLDQKPATGEIIIKRDTGSGSACSSRIFVDAIPIADLWSGEKIIIFLPEGDHIFSAWPNGICGGGLSETRGTVTPGKRLIFRIGYGSNGDYFIVPTAF
ncbi:MAG: hypothetical protein COW04_03505 [Deltaproteobacteria bacterium CG12_big_fil_rev_8_21_14_0_65_43_10]|nr:MAG: hypothetical protein AUK23_07525 [Deltaproteobacteria bacterium CG2_30_43_15]PIQ46198.1 MAG: hypothetical protein COW04_03505 [Deltaproteobacteria bacterium CG12_big_fil_rev_8_21_14_0_65_43_10]PIU86005.1 MAG: hypothetical protein COS67_04875 [Deltaproteobacteria bacterium CG06_land_8_20_14_3_00_44_19]PIX22798.1 MAG: hypothetical protein COZ68_11195 [Deltaproteobacteria bacterium CG_4_8_14_3_um_filter_43_13]PIZ18895.1 MAG: hypothetical protein COY50_12925 [Deltaproteobacteria bacterium C